MVLFLRSEVEETDMEQAIIHGKADLFESFLRHTADLIEDVNPYVAEVLKHMAQAHNIIHETKEGEHRETWEQEVEAEVEDHMHAWREVHAGGGDGHGHGEDPALKEFKEESTFRTKVVLDYAMTHVKLAFVALKTFSAGQKPSSSIAKPASARRPRSATAPPAELSDLSISLTPVAKEDDDNEGSLLRTPSTPKSSLMERVLTSKADDRKQAGMLKLKQAMAQAHTEIDVIQLLGYIRADIWDDWMGEVIINMASVGTIRPAVITAVEELQYLQTHLFASKEEDIFGVELGFNHGPTTSTESDDEEAKSASLAALDLDPVRTTQTRAPFLVRYHRGRFYPTGSAQTSG